MEDGVVDAYYQFWNLFPHTSAHHGTFYDQNQSMLPGMQFFIYTSVTSLWLIIETYKLEVMSNMTNQKLGTTWNNK